MAQRTTTTKVEDILGGHYDGTTDVQPFIDMAWPLVDAVAANDTNSVLNATLLTNIETLLSADFYCLGTPLASTSKIGRSSESYQDRRSFWEQAKRMDLSGYLARLGRSPVQFKWLGKRRSEETEYIDRD